MRLFVAIPLFAAAVLRGSLDTLRRVRGLRVVPEGSVHLTIKFLGQVREAVIPDLTLALGGIRGRRFSMSLEGVDAFPSLARPRVVFIQVQGPAELFELAEGVHDATPLIPRDKPFHPHVMIARGEGRVELPEIKVARREVAVDSFCLMESVTRREGPEYRVVERFSLGDSSCPS